MEVEDIEADVDDSPPQRKNCERKENESDDECHDQRLWPPFAFGGDFDSEKRWHDGDHENLDDPPDEPADGFAQPENTWPYPDAEYNDHGDEQDNEPTEGRIYP